MSYVLHTSRGASEEVDPQVVVVGSAVFRVSSVRISFLGHFSAGCR